MLMRCGLAMIHAVCAKLRIPDATVKFAVVNFNECFVVNELADGYFSISNKFK